ncbi:hypothetical protein SCLCIDRAFT_29834 [Scleroderma citrinum Foug A]|uniref:Uncharacterized protein n=1 Tax=Scleroderma citrinum Foug A TaxID=1036808 RepID=A0A0C2ZUD6_9AGAM|nr:hypothetical protein SCLCIDRAFT_29834 [Scleroderma citrinum Foug A]
MGVVFVGLAQERLEVTYEPLWLLNLVAQAFECSLVDDPQATVLREQIGRVRSLINCTLQVLSAPTASTHEREEDTTEDLHTVLTRTTAWINFAGHPLQDMWGALMHIGKRTEQSQICTLDLRLGRARLSMGEDHCIYLQSDRSIIPDGPYILGEYKAIRICNPVPQEDLPNGYAMHMDALAGPPGPRPLVPAKLRTCFMVHAKVNSCKALMMVDTGSMTNFVSPAFTTVAKLAAFTLESQLALQLGCVGSQLKITHGTHAPMCIGNITHNMYFDVANINWYDCILGLPFLRNN